MTRALESAQAPSYQSAAVDGNDYALSWSRGALAAFPPTPRRGRFAVCHGCQPKFIIPEPDLALMADWFDEYLRGVKK